MKKALIILPLALLGFTAGLVGLYFALPHVDPKRAAEAKERLDSLGIAAPSVLADLPSLDALLRADSLAADSLAKLMPEPVIAVDAAALADRDSLDGVVQTLQAQLAEAEKQNTDLQERLQTLEERLNTLETRQAEASALSTTLSKLEGRELSAILQQISLPVLTELYQEASSRNRTKLLQAMAPDRAALFVNTLMLADADTAGSAPQADGPAESDELQP